LVTNRYCQNVLEAIMDADDLAESRFHLFQPHAGHTEGSAKIAEVVVVTLSSDRIQQRADRLRKVLVDVGVGPPDAGASVGGLG
jgi:hypothetical protein